MLEQCVGILRNILASIAFSRYDHLGRRLIFRVLAQERFNEADEFMNGFCPILISAVPIRKASVYWLIQKYNVGHITP